MADIDTASDKLIDYLLDASDTYEKLCNKKGLNHVQIP